MISFGIKPVIQANSRLKYEDDLRSGGLFYCVSQLADSTVTLGECRDGYRWRRKGTLGYWKHPAALGKQQFDSLVSVNCACS